MGLSSLNCTNQVGDRHAIDQFLFGERRWAFPRGTEMDCSAKTEYPHLRDGRNLA